MFALPVSRKDPGSVASYVADASARSSVASRGPGDVGNRPWHPRSVPALPAIVAHTPSPVVPTGAVRSLVPGTSPAVEWMVKLTCSVVTEPELKARNCPGSLTLLCAPIVMWPVSSNVPGYGPLAVPEAVKSSVDVPALSHVACSFEKLPNRLSPCRLGGACATARAQGSQSKRAVARRHPSRTWCAV